MIYANAEDAKDGGSGVLSGPAGEVKAEPGQVALWESIEQRTNASPHARALLEPGLEWITYGRLWGLLNELCRVLQAAGVEGRDTVASILPDGAHGLASMLGVMRVCACAPLDPGLTPGELEADLVALGAVAAIVARGDESAAALADGLGLTVIEVGPSGDDFAWTVRGEARRPGARARSNGGASLLLHTSATTGRRKLVPLTNDNLQAIMAGLPALTEADRLLLLARQFHIQGVVSPLAQWLAGGSVVAPGKFAPAAATEWLRTLEPTWYTCGPTTHRAILAELRKQASDGERGLQGLASLRFVRSAGATLSDDLRRELAAALQTQIMDVYGLTETGGLTSYRLGEQTPVGSVGRSLGAEIMTMSPQGVLLDEGMEGEIVVRGKAVMSGYVNDEEANERAFRDGWFRTGDLGWVDVEGFLYLIGRIKEIINRGGQKIIPDEIDAVLSRHAGVREAAAFGVPHPTLGEDVACAVVLREGAEVEEAALRSFVGERLASFKVPRQIFFCESIPRGSTGKAKRLELREWVMAEAAAREQFERETAAAARDPNAIAAEWDRMDEVEGTVAALWTAALGTAGRVTVGRGAERGPEQIGLEEDFFVLGGDSLAAVSMLAELEQLFTLPRPLSAEQFLDAPTIKNLAAMLKAESRAEEEPGAARVVVPVQSGGREPRLFLIPANTGRGLYFRRLARHLGKEWPMSLVWPDVQGPFRPLYLIEDAAEAAVAAIQEAQPAGPYVVGGFCQGGVVAFETARRLQLRGERVLLILFDTPMPGGLRIARRIKFYQAHARSKISTARSSGDIRPLMRVGHFVLRRAVWLTLRRLRPVMAAAWGLGLVRTVCGWSMQRYFSPYTPAMSKAPALHLMAQEAAAMSVQLSRYGWETVAGSGLSTFLVPGDHESFFTEANLELMSARMREWIAGELREAVVVAARELLLAG